MKKSNTPRHTTADSKVCTRCGIDKPVDDYSPTKLGRLGRTTRCKECVNEIRRAKPRQARAKRYCASCGGDISHRRADCELCKDCRPQAVRDAANARYAADPERLRAAIRERWNSLAVDEQRRRNRSASRLYKFGMTLEQYDLMLEEQRGVCAICHEPETHTYKGMITEMVVDHDRACCPGSRSCGECVRGLLCHKCNSGLGMFNDDIAAMCAAIAYLRKNQRDAE